MFVWHFYFIFVAIFNDKRMIAEFRVSNFFSIRSEQMISFVATPDKFMKEEYCNKVTDDVSLLKVGVIYGANASGKSNVLKALSFFKQLMQRVPQDRNEPMKLVPFLLDEQSRNEHCRMGMDFYLDGVRYVLNIEFDDVRIYEEALMAYTTNRPTNLYRRIYNKEKDATEITFSGKAKLSQKSQTIIEGNTVNNCSVIAAFGKSNVEASQLNAVYDFFSKHCSDHLTPDISLSDFTRNYLENDRDGSLRRFLVFMLKASDFNIDNVELTKQREQSRMYSDFAESRWKSTEGQLRKIGVTPELLFKHKTDNGTFDLPESYESRGTMRFMGMTTILKQLLFDSHFIAIDELETSIHYELLSYLIKVFIANSDNTSQLLFTTHDINLLNEDFVRRDTVWFTDKNSEGETHIERLSSMGLHKNLSPYNAYKQGKLVNLPFLGSQYLDLKEIEG